jgi:hypothetical protein
MKHFLLATLLIFAGFAATAKAQCSFPQATLTDAIYWAAQPPAVQALRGHSADPTIAKQAATLATQGYTIDVPIDVYGWDAVCVMGYRLEFGYTWVPSALQANIAVAPGVTQPGSVSYDPNHAPAGSIKVSLNAKDYPPFIVPVVVPPSTALVGACFAGSNICVMGPGAVTAEERGAAGLVNGKTVVQAGVTFTFHSVATPFGNSVWFTN